MKVPTQCIYWKEPERIVDAPMRNLFELLHTYEEESHEWRHLLKCRECGQLYFFEFYEEIDWKGGDDSQYCTYLPVYADTDMSALTSKSPVELLGLYPRLQLDRPTGAKETTVRWVLE